MIDAPVGFICRSCSVDEDDIDHRTRRRSFAGNFRTLRRNLSYEKRSLVVVPTLIVAYIISYLLFNVLGYSPASYVLFSNNLLQNVSGPIFQNLIRFISYGFIHANFFHLLSNSISLLLIAPYLERQLGANKFFGLYSSGLLIGGAATFLLAVNSSTVGASGAIMALFGFFAFNLYRLTNSKFAIIFFVAIMLFQFLFQANVDLYAHIFGFTAGALYGLYPKLLSRTWLINTAIFVILFVMLVAQR